MRSPVCRPSVAIVLVLQNSAAHTSDRKIQWNWNVQNRSTIRLLCTVQLAVICMQTAEWLVGPFRVLISRSIIPILFYFDFDCCLLVLMLLLLLYHTDLDVGVRRIVCRCHCIIYFLSSVCQLIRSLVWRRNKPIQMALMAFCDKICCFHNHYDNNNN